MEGNEHSLNICGPVKLNIGHFESVESKQCLLECCSFTAKM